MGQGSAKALGAVGQPLFATTHWSVVLAAGDQQTPEGAAALERLCRTYWYPLYAYVRREGHSPDDAQDLTQEFFARWLARMSFTQVSPDKGKFRSFLLASLRHFLSDQRDHARALKRGGGVELLSWNAQEAEDRYRLEPVDRLDAEKIYERRWAMAVLRQALDRLRAESAAAGKAQWFERLRSFLSGDSDSSSAETAVELGLTDTAFRGAVHRLRQRYRELVREEIAHTVSHPSEIEEEIRYLIAVIKR